MASAEILLKVLSPILDEVGKGAPRISFTNVEVVFSKASWRRGGDDKDFTRLCSPTKSGPGCKLLRPSPPTEAV